MSDIAGDILNPSIARLVLDTNVLVAALAECPFSYRPTLPDPKDEMVLDAAINGQADLLVTRNLRDFLPAAATFAFKVVSPLDALHWLEEHS